MTTRMIVLYHGNCPDGFAAAWAAWRHLGDRATYIPCSYGDDPPNDIDGSEWVYILDFSYKRDVMKDIARRAKQVTVLDHHVTAQQDLEDLDREHDNVAVYFNMKRSGATMAWLYFQGQQPCWLVDYAEDRDLWKHALPRSREINAYLQAGPRTFEAYTRAYEAGPDAVAAWGEGCLVWMRYYVESVKRLAIRGRFLGHENIPIVNAPYTATSEVVGELAEDAPFAVGWHVRADNNVAYSLRSRGDFNVAELAATMGGGGHVRAAGFHSERLPWELEEESPWPPPRDLTRAP